MNFVLFQVRGLLLVLCLGLLSFLFWEVCKDCVLLHCSMLTIIEEFEDAKGVIRIRKLKKNRQHNGQKKKDNKRSTKHTHKTKDWVARTPLKIGGWTQVLRKGKQFLLHQSFPFIDSYSQLDSYIYSTYDFIL